jgi:CRISPR type IV-associated protein Csf3
MDYTPLRVEFHLVEPIVAAAFPRHLDALVAFSVTKTALDGGACDPSTPIRDLAADLPFAKLEKDGDWTWAASALVPDGIGEQHVRMWRTHTPVFDYAERFAAGQIKTRTKLPLKPFAQVIDTQRGPMKNMLERYPVQYVSKFEAWCLGTDIDEIENRLSGIVALGARRRVGHGLLKAPPSVFVDERAHELCRLRVLPWKEGDAVPLQAAVRPPYWAPEMKRQAFCPPLLLG